MRTICWFSHGVASAVATKITLALGPATIACIDTGAEHEDNERFRRDCEELAPDRGNYKAEMASDCDLNCQTVESGWAAPCTICGETIHGSVIDHLGDDGGPYHVGCAR